MWRMHLGVQTIEFGMSFVSLHTRFSLLSLPIFLQTLIDAMKVSDGHAH